METGCQNIQLCSSILKLAFPPEVIGVLFMFPLVYAALQIIEASVLIVLFWSHRWVAGRMKGEGTAEGSSVCLHAVVGERRTKHLADILNQQDLVVLFFFFKGQL